MKPSIIINHPSHLTIDWAQNVINQHAIDANVTKINTISIDTGTTTRVRLAIEHNRPELVANRWFVKLPSLNWRARLITALPRLLATEIRFYQELSKTIPLNQPTVLAGHSHFGKGSTLVLADIAEVNATPGKISDALSAHQASLVIKELARLHAHFWAKVDNNPEHQWLNSSVRQLEDKLGTVLAVPLMKLGLDRAGNIIPGHLHAAALHYARHRKKAMQFLSSGSKTLIHHDCHPGNLFWCNGQPGFLDWQMVRIGEGISDVAYFLATALTPAIRQQHEDDLLSLYYRTLMENNVIDINLETLRERYRAHLSYPFEAMIVTLAIGGMMELQSNLELIKRTAIAIEDHNTYAALPI